MELILPYYTAEPLRDDARGRWTARVELGSPTPRHEILGTISEFVASRQNKHELLTGYIAGDAGVQTGTTITFARDPHPQSEFITLSPVEYDDIIDDFSDYSGYRRVAHAFSDEFRSMIGRVVGYGSQPARPMQDVWDLTPANTSLTAREGYFFSARYGDQPWNELAAIYTGDKADLPSLAGIARALHQERFVCEMDEHTVVFNLDK